MTLNQDNIDTLRELFHAEPVSGRTIVAMTGLDVKQLEAEEILRKLGRWDDGFYRGAKFPYSTPQ